MLDGSVSIAAIIVNYAVASVIMEHIDKLVGELQGYRDAHIYIVDNASPNDEYAELMKFVDSRGLASRISVIDAGANLGFAGGNNLAFERARARGAEFVFFLNPDAYPLPGAVETLLDCLKARPDAAVAGPRLLAPGGEALTSFYSFPTLSREFAFESEIGVFISLTGCASLYATADSDPIETDWVSGAAFLLRVEAAAEKLMDDAFFLYFEETDMMRALKRRGWRIWHVPRGKTVHVGGVSTGVQHDTKNARRLPPYWFQSWRHYYQKNYGPLYRFGAGVAKTLGVIAYNVKCALKGQKSAKPRRYLTDVFANCVHMGSRATSDE